MKTENHHSNSKRPFRLAKTIFAVTAVLLSSPLWSCQNSDKGKDTMLSHQDFLDKYSLLTDTDHILISKTAEEILSAAQNNESFVLFIGFDSCPWCQVLAPVLNAQAKEQHIPELWYWDPKAFRGDGAKQKHTKEYLKILDLIGLERPRDDSDKGITGISRISVPLIATINYGSIEIFAEAPVTIGSGKLMLDAEGQPVQVNDSLKTMAIRYQDGFMLNAAGQVLGAYMWDSLITGYQVPSKYKDHREWLNRPEFIEPMREQLRKLLNISVCNLCSQ